jgi:hypothetical protein
LHAGKNQPGTIGTDSLSTFILWRINSVNGDSRFPFSVIESTAVKILVEAHPGVKIMVDPSAVREGKYSISAVLIPGPSDTGLKGTGFFIAFEAKSPLSTHFLAVLIFRD